MKRLALLVILVLSACGRNGVDAGQPEARCQTLTFYTGTVPFHPETVETKEFCK